MADTVDEIVQVLDVLDLGGVVVTGFSGGGPSAIGVGAARADRVSAVLTFGCIAPFRPTSDWFAGMADPSGLAAAVKGLDVRTAHPDSFEPTSFILADHAALEGRRSDLVVDTQAAQHYGLGGAIDDDMAFVRPWGFSLDDCTVPVTLVHGLEDRVVPVHHAHALAAGLPRGTPAVHADEGHVSLLLSLEEHLRTVVQDRGGAR